MNKPAPVVDAWLRARRARVAERRTRRARSCCVCSYDLLNTPGPVCTECGTPRSRADSWRTDGVWSAGRLAMVGLLWGALGGLIFAAPGVCLVASKKQLLQSGTTLACSAASIVLLLIWMMSIYVVVKPVKRYTTTRKHFIARLEFLLAMVLFAFIGVFIAIRCGLMLLE